MQNQQLSRALYIDSQHVSNHVYQCGNSTNPCTNLQYALDYFTTSTSNLIHNFTRNNSNSNILTIQLTFIMLNNDNNFCGYTLNTIYNENIYYEMDFMGNTGSDDMITLTCAAGEVNFIQERMDFTKMTFSQLSLIGIIYNSCYAISLTLSSCYITNGGFMTYYQPIECPNYYASNRTVRNLYISQIQTNNAAILIGNVKNGIVENIILNGISAISLNNMESVQLLNIQVLGAGLFSTKDVNSIYLNNFISKGSSFNIHIRDFKSFILERSSFDSYNYFVPAVNVDRGDYAKISGTSVSGSSQWLSAKTVNQLVLSNIKFTNNYVMNVRKASPIFILSCDNILIENSYFDGNSGSTSGAILIDDYLNVDISNNTFKNGKSPLSGGAILMENYQTESLLQQAAVSISNNLFINNVCGHIGGAIAINTIVVGVFKGNKFIRNQAFTTGGGLCIIEHCKYCTIESYFEENRANGSYTGLEASIVFSDSISNRLLGTGGALTIFTEPSFIISIDGSVFVRNYASKGGAITMGFNSLLTLQETSPYVKNCKFEGNSALKTGNDIYTIALKSSGALLRSFINQTEENQYSFSSTPSIFRMEKVSTKKVYPGQAINIKFYVENIFGRELDIQTQFVLADQHANMLPYLSYSNSDNKTLVFTPYSLITELPPVSQFNLTLRSEDSGLSVVLPFEMLNCPQKFLLEKNFVYSKIVYQCVSDNRLDLGMVLGIAIPLGILFLTIGIVMGGLSVYVIRFIVKQISLLRTKQRAEKSLEKRIIDKKIIFNSDPSDTNSSYTKYNTKRSDLSIPLIESGIEKTTTPSFVIPIESIDIIKKLAEGGLGIIYLGKLWKKIDVAIKLLKSDEQDEEFEQEVSLLSSLRHDNIVTFYGICMSDDSKYMITEFVEKGSLDRALYKSRIGEQVMSLKKKMLILIATARGIEYLHGLTPIVVHRDLKPGNILLEDKNQAKICDFGISRTVSNSTVQQTAMTTNLGTLIYCPNEVIEGPTSTNKASKQTATKIDIFSFAVIMWEVFFEIIPYSPSTGKLTPLFELTKEESEMLTMNSFNIPYFVVKGIRPLIPFRTDEQIREWIGKYMPEQVYNSNMIQFVKRYFNMIQRGWSIDATKRPDITTILQELEELNNMIR